MHTRSGIGRLQLERGFHYTKKTPSEKVREMNNMFIARRSITRAVSVAFFAAIFVFAGMGMTRSAVAQGETVVEDFFTLMASLPDPIFSALPDLMEALDSADPGDPNQESLFTDTRAYLEEEGIAVEDEYHEVIVINMATTIDPDDPWYVFSEPRGREEEIGYLPQCVGFAFEEVVLIIQQVVPLEVLMSPDRPIGVNPYIQVIASLSGQSLNELRTAMASLNKEPYDSPARQDFLSNPREWALDNGILLSADQYRVAAFDLGKVMRQAEEIGIEESGLPPFSRSPAREGLAVRAECSCLLYENLCLIIQEAL